MMMKKIMHLSCNFQFKYKPIAYLITLSIALLWINTPSALGQPDSTENQNMADSIMDKKMNRTQSKILHLEKRLEKRPDDIIAREELIKLRIRYFKMFDGCLTKLETQLKEKKDTPLFYGTKIIFLRDKKECAVKIKEDYNQLADSQVKYLADLRRRALRGSSGFEGNIRYMKTYDIERIIYELVKEDNINVMQHVLQEIRKEKERLMEINKDYIEKYQDEEMKLETLLKRAEDKYESSKEKNE